MAPQWVITLASLTIAAMSLTAMAVGVVTSNWEPLTITMPSMMLFAGFAFGIKIIRRQGNGNGNGNGNAG